MSTVLYLIAVCSSNSILSIRVLVSCLYRFSPMSWHDITLHFLPFFSSLVSSFLRRSAGTGASAQLVPSLIVLHRTFSSPARPFASCSVELCCTAQRVRMCRSVCILILARAPLLPLERRRRQPIVGYSVHCRGLAGWQSFDGSSLSLYCRTRWTACANDAMLRLTSPHLTPPPFFLPSLIKESGSTTHCRDAGCTAFQLTIGYAKTFIIAGRQAGNRLKVDTNIHHLRNICLIVEGDKKILDWKVGRHMSTRWTGLWIIFN